jgi:Pyruvate/2-oxoacid:ferredoxin oxidoreductase gamma subunit
MVVVLDDSVTRIVNVTQGLKEHGKLLINSKEDPSIFKQQSNLEVKYYTVDAEKISFDILGNARAFNTAMLGGLLNVESLVNSDTMSRVSYRGLERTWERRMSKLCYKVSKE